VPCGMNPAKFFDNRILRVSLAETGICGEKCAKPMKTKIRENKFLRSCTLSDVRVGRNQGHVNPKTLEAHVRQRARMTSGEWRLAKSERRMANGE